MTGASVVAIVNPASSSGRTMRRLPRVEAALRERYPDVEVLQTTGPGHATLLTRRALEAGAGTVLSIGGDGTNNEVLCGFTDHDGRNRFPSAVLGLVASGTGSDFHRYLRREFEPTGSEPIQVVDYGIVRFVDHEGHRCVRPFLNEASAGISGYVDYQVVRSNKMLGPTGTYVVGALKAISSYRNHTVRVSIDGGPTRVLELTIAVMANGQYFGGGMHVAPGAACNDGTLQMVCADGLSRWAMVRMLMRIFSGSHVGRPGVTSEPARRVELTPARDDDVVLMDIDGEQPGRLPAEIEIAAGSLRLLPAALG